MCVSLSPFAYRFGVIDNTKWSTNLFFGCPKATRAQVSRTMSSGGNLHVNVLTGKNFLSRLPDLSSKTSYVFSVLGLNAEVIGTSDLVQVFFSPWLSPRSFLYCCWIPARNTQADLGRTVFLAQGHTKRVSGGQFFCVSLAQGHKKCLSAGQNVRFACAKH